MIAATFDNISNFVLLLRNPAIDFSYTNALGNTVLHHLAQNYSENNWDTSPYDILERIKLLPIEKLM
ncbi:MAG: hypothetical protein ACRCTQ_07055 [Brevinemataceae bacterium]